MLLQKKGRKPNFRSSLEKTFKKNPENEDWNYNGVEFKMEVIKESTACSTWEYIRLSLTPAEIKIWAAGVNIKIVLTEGRQGKSEGREDRTKGSKDKSSWI